MNAPSDQSEAPVGTVVELAARCGDLALALESIRDNSRDPEAVSIARAALEGGSHE